MGEALPGSPSSHGSACPACSSSAFLVDSSPHIFSIEVRSASRAAVLPRAASLSLALACTGTSQAAANRCGSKDGRVGDASAEAAAALAKTGGATLVALGAAFPREDRAEGTAACVRRYRGDVRRAGDRASPSWASIALPRAAATMSPAFGTARGAEAGLTGRGPGLVEAEGERRPGDLCRPMAMSRFRSLSCCRSSVFALSSLSIFSCRSIAT
mmetsp:Transcript_90569/g.253060  ORF Transcript_90569/g.253060 Transcript_90569/m.253060 type:complete len:214 (+) Transcript_90569:174-815(+)